MPTLVARQFANLFEGRRDAYGTEHGSAARVAKDDPFGDWYSKVKLHLSGIAPVGVYPVLDNQCRWGCIDLDVASPEKTKYDYETPAGAHVDAQRIVGAALGFNLYGYIERTRSDGRHVWFFFPQWVDSAQVRRALLVLCDTVGASVREVNPKSENLNTVQLGNYVRLPYPGGLSTEWHRSQRRYIYDPKSGWPLGLEPFLALVEYSDASYVAAAARLWRPPASTAVEIERHEYTGDAFDQLIKRLNGLAYTIFEEGPLSARHTALFKLAVECKASGLAPSEAFLVVEDADARWGKFSGRADCEQRIMETVRKGYSLG